MPESVFDTTENKYIRLFIYKYFKIKAVISLPQLAFEPFTSTKTSLLIAQKKTKDELNRWNNHWQAQSEVWGQLSTRGKNLLAVYLDGKDRNKYPSIKDLSEREEKEILIKLLNLNADLDYEEIKVQEIIKKYKDEIKTLCDYDNDTTNEFGFVNTWWVFKAVSKLHDYKILMAEVNNVGYKRTKRGEKIRKNELFRIDADGKIIVDDGVYTTVLDSLRDIKWA